MLSVMLTEISLANYRVGLNILWPESTPTVMGREDGSVRQELRQLLAARPSNIHIGLGSCLSQPKPSKQRES